MREIIARLVCGATVGVVLALAWVFASRHNPPSNAHVPGESGSPATLGRLDQSAELGRLTYARHDCASCHAISGRGNPRHPLDGVGERRSAEELREYVTATGAAANKLSDTTVRRKARYREIPADEMTALINYLSTLSEAK